MIKSSKIFLAGHNGMVGSAVLRELNRLNFTNVICQSSKDLDLSDQAAVERYFLIEKPVYVILAAAKVGGILANNEFRAEFLYNNLMIQNNVIHASHKNGVKKLLFLGSSCIYPKFAEQPIKEDSLLTGILEPTNEPYAIAKIAGIKMCENYYRQYQDNFISVMPTNLYGPNDNFDLNTSHVLPALIRKFTIAKYLELDNWEKICQDLNSRPLNNVTGNFSKNEILHAFKLNGITKKANRIQVQLWGSGDVYREFLHVDDLAKACVFVMNSLSAKRLYDDFKKTHINIGTGIDLTIKDLALLVKDIVGSNAEIVWNKELPDGTPKKQLDITLLRKLGFTHSIPLKEGITNVANYYQSNYEERSSNSDPCIQRKAQ